LSHFHIVLILEGIVLNLRGKFRNSKLNFWEDVPTLKIHQKIKGFFKIIESPSYKRPQSLLRARAEFLLKKTSLLINV
jgi:hypothetical protein